MLQKVSPNIHYRLVSDVALTGKDFPMMLKGIIYGCAILSIDLCFIINGVPQIVFLAPFLILAGYWMKVFYFRALRQLRLLGETAKTELHSRNAEIRAGLEHIRSMGWYEFYLNKSFDAIDEVQRIHFAKFQLHAWLGFFLHLTTSVMMVVATALAVTMAGSLSAGGVFLAFFCAQFTCSELSSFFEWGTSYGDSSLAAARMRAFMASLAPDNKAPALEADRGWPEHGSVSFESVDAAYKTVEFSNTVLRGVSLTIKAGERVGVIGRTGRYLITTRYSHLYRRRRVNKLVFFISSGKSTLMLTLLNFLDYDGSITIDGVEISDIPQDQLRSRMTILPQQAVTFPGTLRDNLIPWDLGNDIKSVTDEEIMSLLQKLSLADHVELYGGINKPAHDMNFSHGQKQLLNIARAILDHRVHNTKIILLDEATSALHSDLEKEVFEFMNKEFRGCTVFIISHKTQLLDEVDVLAEFSGGRLVRQLRV